MKNNKIFALQLPSSYSLLGAETKPDSDVDGVGFYNIERKKWETALCAELGKLSAENRQRLYQDCCLYRSGYTSIAQSKISCMRTLVDKGYVSKYGETVFVETVYHLLAGT